MLHFGLNWEERKQGAGRGGGGEVFRLEFLRGFFPPVFPLIRKALCKSSYSEIRGSKKDCMVECYNLLP